MSNVLQTDLVGVILLALVVFPGFISILVFHAIRPTGELQLKNRFFEALAFGGVNFALTAWIVPIAAVFIGGNPWQLIFGYLAFVLALLILPALWPVLLLRLLNYAAQKGWVRQPADTAWDHVFLKQQSYWIIVTLNDGSKIGGFYGGDSFAGVYGRAGHLYIEALYELEPDGSFGEMIPDTAGIILSPTEYRYIELKHPAEVGDVE